MFPTSNNSKSNSKSKSKNKKQNTEGQSIFGSEFGFGCENSKEKKQKVEKKQDAGLKTSLAPTLSMGNPFSGMSNPFSGMGASLKSNFFTGGNSSSLFGQKEQPEKKNEQNENQAKNIFMEQSKQDSKEQINKFFRTNNQKSGEKKSELKKDSNIQQEKSQEKFQKPNDFKIKQKTDGFKVALDQSNQKLGGFGSKQKTNYFNLLNQKTQKNNDPDYQKKTNSLNDRNTKKFIGFDPEQRTIIERQKQKGGAIKPAKLDQKTQKINFSNPPNENDDNKKDDKKKKKRAYHLQSKIQQKDQRNQQIVDRDQTDLKEKKQFLRNFLQHIPVKSEQEQLEQDLKYKQDLFRRRFILEREENKKKIQQQKKIIIQNLTKNSNSIFLKNSRERIEEKMRTEIQTCKQQLKLKNEEREKQLNLYQKALNKLEQTWKGYYGQQNKKDKKQPANNGSKKEIQGKINETKMKIDELTQQMQEKYSQKNYQQRKSKLFKKYQSFYLGQESQEFYVQTIKYNQENPQLQEDIKILKQRYNQLSDKKQKALKQLEGIKNENFAFNFSDFEENQLKKLNEFQDQRQEKQKKYKQVKQKYKNMKKEQERNNKLYSNKISSRNSAVRPNFSWINE